jgi:hypothetical protein
MAVRTNRLDFDTVPVYQPIFGGVRHLTTLPEPPPTGTVVQALCELTYKAGVRMSPRGYDCSFCRNVFQKCTRRTGDRTRP